jgi:hypothetical protein
MLMRRDVLKLFPQVAVLFAVEPLTSVAASGQAGAAQTGNSVPAYSSESPKVAAGAVDVKQLLLLMDTDKNGKISKKEFMDFMSAEFDRLDKDKSGQLDVKELQQSQLTTTQHGGTRR